MNKNSNNIKKIRNLRGMDRENLALKLGVTTAMVGYLERGERQLTEKYINRLSEILNCSKAQILGEELIDEKYEIRDNYVLKTNEIISEIDSEEKLTEEGRAILFRKIYKLVYEFYELPFGKKEFYSFIKKILENDSQ